MKNKTIAEFARIGGVGVETIRFYQRQGLLHIPEESNLGKTRRYGEEDIRRLRFIRSAKKAGFTLREIKELLDLEVQNDRDQVREIAQKRIVLLNTKIAELSAARESLHHLVSECEKADSIRCPILMAFEHK